MNIYSIKNEKLGFFNRPIYCESYQEALTYIQNILASDADRALKGLRGDLSLYLLGSIDFTSGEISPSYEFIDDGVTKIYQPLCICTLDEIFDSIPDDQIKDTNKEIDRVRCDLRAEFLELFDGLSKDINAKFDGLNIKKGKK
jgi:hypothetical protein